MPGPYQVRGLYSVQVGRPTPGLFVFLLDQSGSMQKPFGGKLGTADNPKKMDAAAEAINKILYELVLSSTYEEEVLDRVYVSVIRYGQTVGPAFVGPLAGRDLVPISEVAKSAPIEETESGTKPIWFRAVGENATPMCQALDIAYQIVKKWVEDRAHPKYPAPIIMNITDGEATDGDPRPHAEQIAELRPEDGNVLMMNCHISEAQAESILYPASTDAFNAIADAKERKFAVQLFEMSSILPPKMIEYGVGARVPVTTGSCGMVFNGEIKDMVQFLESGQ